MINLLNMIKVKSKYRMASFRYIYCWHWPQAAYQYSVSTFNFKKAFVISSVTKTSLKVLKKQKARYLSRNKSCKAYFIQRFIIAPNWNKLWIFDNTSALNLLWIPSVLSFCPVVWSAISLLFHRIFLLYQTENLFKSMKQ